MRVTEPQSTIELQESLAFALEATRTGLWTFDGQASTVECDDAARAMIGSPSESVIPLQRFLTLFADRDQTAVSRLMAIPDNAMGERHELEYQVRRLDTAAPRWIAMRARRSTRLGFVIGSVRDITEHKRDDEQVHMLMREVTHRSKNLLAIIQAMARQTVKDSLSAVEFEDRFSARLRGLSCSHELLASQDWRGASLKELAEGHLSHLREQHGDRVGIEGPIVFVRPEAAQNIGLALNELGSNAQRFGALSGDQGTVRVRWHVEADETRPQALNMLWTESGGSATISPPLRQGFGTKVMERVVARALNAEVKMSYAPTGLLCSIRIPLSHIASDIGA